MIGIADSARFWWENVTEPHGYALDMASELMDAHSILVEVPGSLPWPEKMVDVVRDEMENVLGYESPSFYDLDVEGRSLDPAEVVLDHLALDKHNLRWRPYQESPQDVVVRSEAISNKIVWVRGVKREDLSKWVDFIAGFKPKTPADGLFVLVSDDYGVHSSATYSNTLVYLPYTGRVGESSVRLFAWVLLSQSERLGDDIIMARYLQSLLSNICKGDVEVAFEVLLLMGEGTRNPLEAVRLVSERSAFSNRGSNESDHIFTLIRNGRHKEALARIWAAQIEVLFPLIESERQKIVESFFHDLVSLLRHSEVMQYGNPISNAQDVELGTLVYLMNRKEEAGQRRLRLPYGTKEQIYLLWRCRNQLAHGGICPPPDVEQLIVSAVS